MIHQRICSPIIEVRCSNPACGGASLLRDDGLKRVFRCPRCRRKLPPPSAADDRRTLRKQDAPSAQSGDLGPATQLGRLQLRNKLGSGSFAKIYHAFDTLLERDVTLKVFHPTDGEECSKDIAHFASEVKALARLRHPHIVPIYDAGREGAYHYIAMAFIEGRTLSETLQGTALDFVGAARVISELAEALAYAHSLGIVHRDVKPSNVLLDRHGMAHLIDFGLAHRREMVWDMSRSALIVGTPAYLAPEQAPGKEDVPQPASDQYSLGAVLFELLCGRPPFTGPPLRVLVSALQEEPPRPRTLNPDVPPGLEAICLKTLAKRPEARYESCQALADDLHRWLHGEHPLAEARPRTEPAPQPPRPRPRWFRQIRNSAASILTVLVSFALMMTVYGQTAAL
jgi:serine/threonine protein kinase